MEASHITAALIGSAAPGLLDDAARHAVARRASVPVTKLPVPQPAPEQEPNQPPAAFVSTMRAILATPAHQAEPLAAEALKALAAAGLVLPNRLIVELLVESRTKRQIADALPEVLGSRGAWLARLDPAWLRGRAVAEPTAEDWDHGSLAKRVAWLRHLRAQDPNAGRKLVAEASKEAAADRAQFLGALEVGLSSADEEFLEAQLGGRSKEVGRAAAALLARLDGSGYQRRALELARASLTVTEAPSKAILSRLRGKSTRTITATAPTKEDLAGEYLADIAQVSLKRGPAERLKALVSVIPPKRWAELDLPLELLAQGALLDGELVDLQAALAEAMHHFKDVAAAKALHPHLTSPKIALLLPPTEQDEHLKRAIKDCATAEPNALGALCEQLAAAEGLSLSNKAATLLLDVVEKRLDKGGPISNTPLTLVAFATDPEAAPSLTSALTRIAQHSKASAGYKSQARAASSTLTLRRSIYQCLESKEPR